jgi:hypothetical protein
MPNNASGPVVRSALYDFGDVIERSRQPRDGAVFHRCALKVNLRHCAVTHRSRSAAGTATEHAAAIEIGVTVLANTDDNHVVGVAACRSAARATGAHVYRGFEPSSSEGVHVHWVYAQDIFNPSGLPLTTETSRTAATRSTAGTELQSATGARLTVARCANASKQCWGVARKPLANVTEITDSD